VSRFQIQLLFVALTICWFAFSAFTLLDATLGDCMDEQLCIRLKDASTGLVLWRWLAGCLILFGAYRFFRKEPE
jgi:hypothetical protein